MKDVRLKELHKTTFLYLIKLFPMGIEGHHSESAIHVDWNETMKQMGENSSRGSHRQRRVRGGGRDNPCGDKVELEASV